MSTISLRFSVQVYTFLISLELKPRLKIFWYLLRHHFPLADRHLLAGKNSNRGGWYRWGSDISSCLKKSIVDSLIRRHFARRREDNNDSNNRDWLIDSDLSCAPKEFRDCRQYKFMNASYLLVLFGRTIPACPGITMQLLKFITSSLFRASNGDHFLLCAQRPR